MLFIQVLVSFIAGGAFVSILSLVAEKTNQQVSGIIMMFPSTLVLGFLFLGLTTSAHHVAEVIPSTLIPLGIIVLSSLIYIYCSIFFSQYVRNKLSQIFYSVITSSIIWFLLASPFARYRFSNLLLGVVGYALIVGIAHVLLKNKQLATCLEKPRYSSKQILVRVIFTGSIIGTVVFLGKTLDPFWGGVFTMFPAATFATLVILHYYYPPIYLFSFVRAVPLGSLSLFGYSISCMLFFPPLGVWLGTVTSYLVSLTIGLLLAKYRLSLQPR